MFAGGEMVFGDAELPVKVNGRDNMDGQGTTMTKDSDLHKRKGRTKRGEGEKSPTPAGALPGECHREGVSLTKVSRGERIRTFDLLLPKQAR